MISCLLPYLTRLRLFVHARLHVFGAAQHCAFQTQLLQASHQNIQIKGLKQALQLISHRRPPLPSHPSQKTAAAKESGSCHTTNLAILLSYPPSLRIRSLTSAWSSTPCACVAANIHIHITSFIHLRISSPTIMPRRARVPDCTHRVLDRVYEQDQTCFVCGRPPALAFLYQCTQDCDPETLHDCLLRADPDPIEPAKSNVRLRLEQVEMSESVILAAEGGHYTTTHLDKLINLKQELQQTISDKIQRGQCNDAGSKLTSIAESFTSKFPPNHDGAYNSTPAKNALPQRCFFRACHACRPYYRERVFISFEAVLAGDFAPMTRASIDRLPTKPANIMRTIGTTVPSFPSLMTLGTVPSTVPTSSSFPYSTEAPTSTSCSSSEMTFQTTQSDVDEIHAQRHPRRRFYSMGRRTSGDIARDLSRLPSFFSPEALKTAVQSIFRPGRDSSSSGSNVTLPLPRTGTARDLDGPPAVVDFDIGALRRVRRQKERNQIKNGTYLGGFEVVDDDHSDAHSHVLALRAASHDDTSDDYSVYSFADEGSEVEVEGGVALREEAVEMHTPDLHAVDLHRGEGGRVFCVGEAEEEVGDVGLQGIIAHEM